MTAGVLVLDKPRGITSFDAVQAVGRILGERKCGHAGTLDPMATGLLVVCLGEASRRMAISIERVAINLMEIGRASCRERV